MMTQDELMELAREAGISGIDRASLEKQLAKFAALVAAKEREVCAVEVETSSQDLSRSEYAAAIRARKD